MRRRNTENEKHSFQHTLYKRINAFDIQGLTMNKERNKFTAGVEYFDLNFDEYQNLKKDDSIIYSQKFSGMLADNLITAQALFTSELKVPLYYLWGYDNDFLVHEIHYNGENFEYRKCGWIDAEKLINFWSSLKQTTQTHSIDYNGARRRTRETRIDSILESAGLEWGGNIDGFIIRNNKVAAIIDCISIGKRSQWETHDLTDSHANPALYFQQKGPKYKTWLSTIILAEYLSVPHFCFTLDKEHPGNEVIGLAGIDYLTKNGINFYNNVSPNKNVVSGLSNIENSIFNLLNNLSVPRVL